MLLRVARRSRFPALGIVCSGAGAPEVKRFFLSGCLVHFYGPLAWKGVFLAFFREEEVDTVAVSAFFVAPPSAITLSGLL